MLDYLYGKRFGSNQILAGINTPTFSNLVILHTHPPMKMEQSVPKRRHIKFIRRGITQKKEYNMYIFNWRGRDVGCILPSWEAILGKTKNEMWFLPLNFASLDALLNGTLCLRNI